jgi:hypothetical protein
MTMALKPMSPATILAYAHADARKLMTTIETSMPRAPELEELLRKGRAYDSLAAELAISKRYEDQNHERIKALEAENALLRVAAGPLVVAALEKDAK